MARRRPARPPLARAASGTLLLLAASVLGLVAACGGDDDETSVATGTAASGDEDATLLAAAKDAGDELAYQDIEVDGRTVRMWDIVAKDAIQAIFEPAFLTVGEVGEQITDDDLVIGVSINGDDRAYGVSFLSHHEVINDVVGGVPIAVTW